MKRLEVNYRFKEGDCIYSKEGKVVQVEIVDGFTHFSIDKNSFVINNNELIYYIIDEIEQ